MNILASIPKWSSSHSVEGDIFIPFAEVHEPFSAWYDSDSGNSRIDYYQGKFLIIILINEDILKFDKLKFIHFIIGMAKTYQLSNKGSFGSSLKIVPVTTETETNTLKCLEVNGTDEMHISPQSTLPDLSDFKVVDVIKLYLILKLMFECILFLIFS